MRFSPRLRTILFVVNMAVMLLPLGGLTFLRVYETEMIRQKEGSLHSQGAYLVSMYRRALADQIPGSDGGDDAPVANLTAEAEFRYLSQHTRDPHRNHIIAREPAQAPARAAGEEILPVILRAQNLNMDQVWVVDQFGVVVASSLGEEGRSLISWEEAQRALQGESVSLLRRIKPLKKRRAALDLILGLGEPHMLYVAIPAVIDNKVAGAVVMAGAPSQITQFLYGNKGRLLNALAVILIVVTLLTLLSSLTISEPIQSLINQTELISKGDPRGLKPIRWPILREIRQLSMSLSHMARTISERSEYITAFARNVSHEFKTPLAGMRGTVELLRENWREMTDPEREKFLANLERDSRRLSSLVTGLLAFARAEVAQPGAHVTRISAAISEIATQYSGHPIVITVADHDKNIGARIAPELFESVTKNILDNVFTHCPPGTEVRVSITHSGGKTAQIEFSDNGPGISPPNLEKIKTPFFTTARDKGGTGLGMSIVRAIAKGHGGTLTIESEQGRGTKVCVNLPLA
jgi:signal transduction histidine kinase